MTTTTKKKTVNHSKYFRVFGNRYRINVVKLLLKEELNVTEISGGLWETHRQKLSQPALSQHLMKLRELKLVTARREQRQIFYTLKNKQAVTRAIKAIEDLAA